MGTVFGMPDYVFHITHIWSERAKKNLAAVKHDDEFDKATVGGEDGDHDNNKADPGMMTRVIRQMTMTRVTLA